jgi:ABC-type sugar transport system permease subunit
MPAGPTITPQPDGSRPMLDRPDAEPLTTTPATAGERVRAKFTAKSSFYFALFLLMMPTIVSMLVFGYYPKLDVVVKAFYRWTPGTVQEYIGTQHFETALNDGLFWQSFQLIGILLAANLVKMWPAILTALALHHMVSDRWRYVFQVAFVVPMVIPSIVWLLVWKSFYEPDFGLFNRIINGTGLMPVLEWLDGNRQRVELEVVTGVTAAGQEVVQTVPHELYTGGLPWLGRALDPLLNGWFRVNEAGQKILYDAEVNELGEVVAGTPELLFPGLDQVFGGVWGMLVIGAFLLALPTDAESVGARVRGYAALVGVSLLVPLWAMAAGPYGTGLFVWVMLAVTLAAFVGLARVIGKHWVLWAFLMLGACWGFYGHFWHAPIVLAVLCVGYEAVRRVTDRFFADNARTFTGWGVLLVASILILLTQVWVRPTEQFDYGSPAWLGNRDLIIPSLIFWGFPWVGTVGVLIYLAGLQQIGNDVYEAAELDGVGPIGRIFKIELPLIMTQVRINLIFMTIGTLTGYEMFLILLGADGGPGNRGMVPGLYMYRKAFIDNEYGYACALGLVLFVMILLLTIVYQRYVKVDK